MAAAFDAGHRETERNLPRLLQADWYPGTWALPATTISAASFLVLVVVFGFLQVGETSRTLFRLPWPSGWTSLAAAAIAWTVAGRCHDRPGRHWPRWWSLFLALASSGVAAMAFLRNDLGKHPQAHALALALLVATLTLLPRLFKLHPAHWLVQHIAPVALGAALFLAVPASLAFGRHAVEDRKQHVTDTLAELTREAAQVREISAFDWSTTSERRQEALRQMGRLTNLPLEQWVPDRYLWQGALLLGEDEKLAQAYRELLDAVVEGIDPNRAPKLWQTQYVWNYDSKVWERDPVFPDLAVGIAAYHWHSGRLLQLLSPPTGEGERLRGLADYYAQKKTEADERLAAFTATWAGEWVPPLVSAPWGESGQTPAPVPMVDLLRKPFLPDGSLRPASLQKLLDLSLEEARQIVDSIPSCGSREYQEEDHAYFRIDCFDYAARLDPSPTVDLRVEMRVVYLAEEPLEPLARADLPAEVFFLFPVPAGTEAAAYREDVVAALEAAVRQEHPEATLDLIDRSGPAKGFSFETRAARRIRMVSHQIDDLSGGVPGIQVRAYYLDRSF